MRANRFYSRCLHGAVTGFLVFTREQVSVASICMYEQYVGRGIKEKKNSILTLCRFCFCFNKDVFQDIH